MTSEPATPQPSAPLPQDGHEGHHHAHRPPDATGKKLLLAMLMNVLIPAAQIAGGLHAHSMALISDAVHNLSDFTALLISYIAHRAGRRGPTLRHSFGLRRMEVLAAVLNATLLGGASVVIAYEALQRLAHPAPVIGQVVILLAGVGIVGNGLSAWLLHGDAQHNLNLRGAFLHMLGDLMTSVAVLVAGVLMQFKPWHWLDPLLSLCIVAFILFSCLMLLKDAVTVLMNAVPKNLDLEAVRSTMEGVPGVQGVHYLHAWNAGGDAIAFTGHVVVPDQPLSATQRLLHLLRQELLVKFGVNHPVLQLETDCCGNGGLLCELSCSPASAGGHVVERCPHGH